MSDLLFSAASTYQSLTGCRYNLTFSNEQTISVQFKPQNFVHLAGLRKLSDQYCFQSNHSATNIFHDILNGKITEYDLQRSVHYDTEARERIQNLSQIPELLHAESAVWDFDIRKCSLSTKIKSKVILFRSEGYNFYLLLGLAPDAKIYYPETFFLRFDNAYLHNQTLVKVLSCEKTSLDRSFCYA